MCEKLTAPRRRDFRPQSRSDDESYGCRRAGADLEHVAAGPIEGLLGMHGEACIDQIAQRAASDPKFGRAMTGVWKHTISDAAWARVRAIQSKVTTPLPEYRNGV